MSNQSIEVDSSGVKLIENQIDAPNINKNPSVTIDRLHLVSNLATSFLQAIQFAWIWSQSDVFKIFLYLSSKSPTISKPFAPFYKVNQSCFQSFSRFHTLPPPTRGDLLYPRLSSSQINRFAFLLSGFEKYSLFASFHVFCASFHVEVATGQGQDNFRASSSLILELTDFGQKALTYSLTIRSRTIWPRTHPTK